MNIKYHRILLKLSGEALAGEKGSGFDENVMRSICEGVKQARDLGAQVGIVVGGGNFWRGRSSGDMERTCADKIGMLATVMNCLAVSDMLRQLGAAADKDQDAHAHDQASCITKAGGDGASGPTRC